MSSILKLISPVPPSVNNYLKPRPFIMHNKAQVSMYETAEAKKYKKEFIKYIKEQVKIQNWELSEDRFQKYYVDCTFYFPRTNMDSNNTYKVLLDSITQSKCVWLDDIQACERTQGIFYDTINPRVEILLHPVNFVGVFPTVKQLDDFKSNCIHCKRYKEGKCSIFKKACEGRIQEEIKDFICTKFNKIKGEN